MNPLNTDKALVGDSTVNDDICEIYKTPMPNFTDDTETQASNEIISGRNVEVPIITIESIEAYNEFISGSAKDCNIVTYDELTEYGAFKMFKVLSDGNNGDYSQYCYTFDDGITLYVTDTSVRLLKENQMQIIDEKNINLNDMRMLTTEDSGMFYLGELGYYYVSGKLLYIKWNDNNLEYRVCGSSLLADYQFEVQTRTAQLLRPDL